MFFIIIKNINIFFINKIIQLTCPSLACSIPNRPNGSKLSLIAERGLGPDVFLRLPVSLRNSDLV